MDAILVVNAGSSSLKFRVFAIAEGGGDLLPQVGGQLDGIGVAPAPARRRRGRAAH